MTRLLDFMQIFAAAGGQCDPADGAYKFFRLTPWYQYLTGKYDELGVCIPQIIVETSPGVERNDIWLIVLAIIDSLLKVSALVAIGFVIYGGIQFTISQGEPDKTNEARNTIINALVGMVIALTAAMIVSFIGNRLTNI